MKSIPFFLFAVFFISIASAAPVVVIGQASVSANISATTCAAGNYSYWTGSEFLCRDDVSGAGGGADTLMIADGVYLYNNSDTMFFNDTLLNITIDARAATINIFDQNLSTPESVSFGALNVTGPGLFTGFNTGNILTGQFDAEFGESLGAIQIGEASISMANLTVATMDFNDTVLFRRPPMAGGGELEFAFVTSDNLVRLLIPISGQGLGIYNPRSMMHGGDLGQSFTTGLVNCTQQGYQYVDCDTDGTGADLGIQDDLEVRGSIYVNESVNATDWTNVTITESQITDLSHTVDTDTHQGNIFDQLLNTTESVVFNAINITTTIFATDWGNVTITESQITDLTHTTDTNVSTFCVGGELLQANGTCANMTIDTTGGSPPNIFDQNLSLGESVTFDGLNITTELRSLDWTNVTITEAQVTDLAHTVDTNVSTFCAGGELLQANGTCANMTIDTGGATPNIFDQNLSTGERVVFDGLNITTELMSLDWTNVTITEAQVTDLAHTTDTDTNASTICSLAEVLLGNSSCLDTAIYKPALTVVDANLCNYDFLTDSIDCGNFPFDTTGVPSDGDCWVYDGITDNRWETGACGAGGGGGAGFLSRINDSDDDTYVEVDESELDDDTIRFSSDGSEMASITSSGLAMSFGNVTASSSDQAVDFDRYDGTSNLFFTVGDSHIMAADSSDQFWVGYDQDFFASHDINLNGSFIIDGPTGTIMEIESIFNSLYMFSTGGSEQWQSAANLSFDAGQGVQFDSAAPTEKEMYYDSGLAGILLKYGTSGAVNVSFMDDERTIIAGGRLELRDDDADSINLNIEGADPGILINDTTSGTGFTITENNSKLRITPIGGTFPDDSMVFDSVGLGVGTNETNTTFHIKGAGLHTAITGNFPSLMAIENTNGNTFFSGIDFYGNQARRIASIMMEQTSGGSLLHFGTSNNYANGVTNDALVIDAAGEVGIGTATPADLFHVLASSGKAVRFETSAAADTVAIFDNTNTGANSDGMIIRIGPNSNPGASNDFIFFQDGDGTNLGSCQGDGAGGVTCPGSSDERFKRNIRNITSVKDKFSLVKPIKYNGVSGTKDVVGFSAQDINSTFPECVTVGAERMLDDGTEIGEKLFLSKECLIAPMWKMIQEQESSIDSLELRIAALEAKK